MPEIIDPVHITAYTATSALGRGVGDQLVALREERSGLRNNDFTRVPLTCAIGRVDGLEQTALPKKRARP